MDATFEIGKILNARYRIVSVLGRGGMSNVYLVEDEKLHSRWALKEMLDIFPEQNKTQLLEQFKKEARILAGMRHPNIPRVFDYFEENNRHYLVMEFLEGTTLTELLEKKQNIPTERVLNWSLQICDVLETLHGAGIIYRDLKPANILVDKEDKIYFIDFGIARLFTGGKIHDTIIIGTPGFASPEHHGRTETDSRSDIFSFGATLHYLLTGIDPSLMPFVFKPPLEVNPKIPEKFSEAVMKATALDPGDRFQSAKEMKNFLEKEVLPQFKKETLSVHSTGSSSPAAETSPIEVAETIIPTSPSPPSALRIKKFFGSETFTVDPVKSYIYPVILSGGAVSFAAMLLSGGILTLPAAAFSIAAVVPTSFLFRQLIKHARKISEEITIKMSGDGLEIMREKATFQVPWDEITSFLIFQQRSQLGLMIPKYKLFTKRGNFEYTDEMRQVQRLNDLIITHANLTLVGESGEYRRYLKDKGETSREFHES